MPDWFWKIMLFVFAVHCLIFTWLAVKQKRLASALAAGAFLLLFFSIAIRIWLPESCIMGVHSYWLPRIPAWILALAGITLSWRRRKREKSNIDIT